MRRVHGLGGPSGAPPEARLKRRRPARTPARRRHPRRPGVELVKDRPGITIPELAEAMGIQQNYLYRVMPGLAEEGKVTKSGRGWHLREGVS